VCNVRYILSRMDFPGTLRPSLFKAGPLGMTDGPDLSFMCSWRDALTLPGSQPQNCKVRMEIGSFPWSVPPPCSLIGKRGLGSCYLSCAPVALLSRQCLSTEAVAPLSSLPLPGFSRCLCVGVLTGPGAQHEEVRQPHLRDFQLW
jgi:hypothetical protein